MTENVNISNILKHMNLGFAYHKIIVNPNGKAIDYLIIDANSVYEELTGLKVDEIKNKKASDVYFNNHNIHIDEYAKVALNGESVEFISYFKPLDKYFQVKSYCDQPGFFAVIFDDVTERKKTKMALEKSLEKYKILADYTFDWEYWKGVGKDFVYVSPSCKRISGFANEEFYNDPELFFNQIDKQYQKIWREHENRTQKQECCEKPITLKFITKTGTIIWLEHICQPVYSNKNEFLGYRGTNRDITEQKLMQQQTLNAAIQAEENERKRVAQELHDGIGPILSTTKRYIEALIKSKNESYREKAREYLLDGIEEAIQQVATISNNLSPHILNDFGLESALNNFIERLVLLNSVNYSIAYNVCSSLSQNLEITIFRVTAELVSNTLKHAKSKNILIRIFEADNDIIIEYLDDGIGFDFDLMKMKKKGMGLFNIINRIQSLNGSVNTDNANKGVNYIIRIPLIDNIIIN